MLYTLHKICNKRNIHYNLESLMRKRNCRTESKQNRLSLSCKLMTKIQESICQETCPMATYWTSLLSHTNHLFTISSIVDGIIKSGRPIHIKHSLFPSVFILILFLDYYRHLFWVIYFFIH